LAIILEFIRITNVAPAHANCLKDRRIGETDMTLISRSLSLAAIALIGSVSAPLADDHQAGEKTFKKCAVCHAIGEGAKNGVGPVLNGLDGRKAGTIDGFKYSSANKNSGITWGEAAFKEYIKNPAAKVPGTTMVFIGLRKEEEIEALWRYLKRFGSDGKPH
jgi:cytochrome c